MIGLIRKYYGRLKIYNVGGKLLNVIKSIYVNNLAWVRVKGGESECFRVDSGVSCSLAFSMYIWLQQ